MKSKLRTTEGDSADFIVICYYLARPTGDRETTTGKAQTQEESCTKKTVE